MGTLSPALSPCLCPYAHLPEPLDLRPSDYRSPGRDASEGARAGGGSEKACPDPAAAVQVLAFGASGRALRNPVYLMQTQPRDCARHYQSLLGCSGPKLPQSACQTLGMALPSPTASRILSLTPKCLRILGPLSACPPPEYYRSKSIINAAVPQSEPARAPAAPACSSLQSPQLTLSVFDTISLPQLPVELKGWKPKQVMLQ